MDNARTKETPLFRDLINPTFISLPIIFAISAYTLNSRYKQFAVNIFDYIDANELLVKFLRDVANSVASIFIIGVCLGTLWPFRRRHYRVLLKLIANGERQKISIRLIRILLTQPLYILGPGLIISASVKLAIPGNYSNNNLYLLLENASYGLIFGLAATIFPRWPSSLTRYVQRFCVLLIIGTTLTCCFNSVDETIELSKSNYYNGTVLTLDDRLITISDSIRYLGKTNTYFILYSTRKKSPVVIKAEKVLQIDFQINR